MSELLPHFVAFILPTGRTYNEPVSKQAQRVWGGGEAMKAQGRSYLSMIAFSAFN